MEYIIKINNIKFIRRFYGFASLFSLLIGMLIYLLFRNLNNIILFSWISKPEYFKEILIPLPSMILTNILKFNLPDMLWFLSGIFLIRFIWFNEIKVQKIYIICFYLIGFCFEITQLSEKVPGTFDWWDLFFMGIGAFIESLLYRNFIFRRCL